MFSDILSNSIINSAGVRFYKCELLFQMFNMCTYFHFNIYCFSPCFIPQQCTKKVYIFKMLCTKEELPSLYRFDVCASPDGFWGLTRSVLKVLEERSWRNEASSAGVLLWGSRGQRLEGILLTETGLMKKTVLRCSVFLFIYFLLPIFKQGEMEGNS